jgi:hypothetical protein
MRFLKGLCHEIFDFKFSLFCCPKPLVERQVKVLIKNLAIFFLFTSKEFLPISFKKFVCLLCH